MLLLKNNYTTNLTKQKIFEKVNSTSIDDLHMPKYRTELYKDSFKIYFFNYNHGKDNSLLGHFRERTRLRSVSVYIDGRIKSEKPIIVQIGIRPNYFAIAFFMFFALGMFILPAIFVNKIRIDGVVKEFELKYKFLYSSGAILILLFCYLDSILPLTKAKKWVIKNLDLVKINS